MKNFDISPTTQQQFEFVTLSDIQPKNAQSIDNVNIDDLQRAQSHGRHIKQSKQAWDEKIQSLENELHVPVFDLQNPYINKNITTIIPFAEHPEFKLRHFRDAKFIIFSYVSDECDWYVSIPVIPTDTPNLLINPGYGLQEWKYHEVNWLQYAPYWGDMWVGGAATPNNIYCELVNRDKKDMKRMINNNSPVHVDTYCEQTIGRNQGLQIDWVKRNRHKHADTVLTLNGMKDKWRPRSNKQAENATKDSDKELISLYDAYVVQEGLSSETLSGCSQELTERLKKWQKTLDDEDYGNCKVVFSTSTIKCLRNGWEMPRLGFQKLAIMKDFFVANLQQAQQMQPPTQAATVEDVIDSDIDSGED